MATATAWRVDGGGIPARHCLAVALVADGKPAQALAELEGVAAAAAEAKHPLTAALWGQAGNAALLAGNAPLAVQHLTAAIAAGPNAPLDARAAWLTDRARAYVAANDLKAARADLDAAKLLAPADAQVLLFSAALAWREGDGARARRDIVDARRLAPADPAIAAEAQRIGVAAMDSPAGRASEPVVPITNPPY